MQFCPKCGAVLIQKRKNFSCPKCKYASREKVEMVSREKFGKKLGKGVFSEKKSSVWPITETTCPKCGNGTAYFWSTQMRAADEAETRFFRCIKCKHVWREYA